MISLTWPQVHAWHLNEHHLAERAPRERLLDVVTHIGGLQAQMASAAELAAWARVEGITPEDVRDALWTHRTLVKTWAMRGTLHLFAADDLPLQVAALRTRTGHRKPVWLRYFNVTLEELDTLIEGVRTALDGRCLTREQLAGEVARVTGIPRLRERLLSGWGEFLKPAAYQGYLCFGPSQGQAVTFVRPDQWLGLDAKQNRPEVDSLEAMQEVLRRYLTAYGPATRDDFARWFGVQPAQLKPVFAGLAFDLEEVQLEGRKAWALASTLEAMSKPPEPAPVRLLPNFDPYIVGLSSPRQYLLPEGTKDRVYRQAGWISPVVLAGGQVQGVWKYDKKRSGVQLTVEMFAPPTKKLKQGIEAEAQRLGSFLGARVDVAYK
jgi:hypothetical protein